MLLYQLVCHIYQKLRRRTVMMRLMMMSADECRLPSGTAHTRVPVPHHCSAGSSDGCCPARRHSSLAPSPHQIHGSLPLTPVRRSLLETQGCITAATTHPPQPPQLHWNRIAIMPLPNPSAPAAAESPSAFALPSIMSQRPLGAQSPTGIPAPPLPPSTPRTSTSTRARTRHPLAFT